ncbi:protein transport protein (SEC31) [Metarhizium album ARSEF 1941]|uniref:Protein transport protein SEC31 n=1 Tax=Metarhizium album (strain ARSEF 1941) TaxID=1081103 RepID=A0A0B2X8B3_METAS|nr:protein transport protein (SEC31) [Metarhizium album ARSEF 1941]KHO02018.1 protein transport protein (SEC31) [Metarhizium album ARSEF 1941]
MVRLREVPRTATFAWSPGSGKPLLVSGTRAGAVDADFSDESKLELWDLSLDDQLQGLELQPLASITTDSRFYDIAWGPADSEHPKGIIAGALENGSLELWDAAKLEAGASDALISQTSKHTGAIKALQFNPLKPQILATAGAKGELYIFDVNDIENPFRLGNVAARSDDIECLAWNRKVSHILATGGAGGFVTVWDLKTKKASLTLNNNRKAVSAIAWDPNNSTKLLTATPDDNTPVLLLWDLRNSNAPERTLQGHEQGILSLSWCSQDSDLVISSGKDNRTLVWNPQTGEKYGELPEMTNWTFQTQFNPHNPNLSATASFDGKITIQNLQNTNPDTSQTRAEKNLDGEEFFRAAQTQPQGASWSLNKAPRWFERPVGATFAFGGKIVIFKPNSSQHGQKRSSKIAIANFSADADISEASAKFQAALEGGDVGVVCQERASQAHTEEEKADWKVIETLAGDNPREQIVEYLGLKQDEIVNGDSKADAGADETKTDAKADENGEQKSKEISDFFGGDEGDDFLSSVAATKGAKTDNPFHLFPNGDTSVEQDITKALMLGNFAKATEICLKEQRIADAFLIANCGGQELVDKVQSAYLANKSDMPSYMRLLGSVIAKNLWDVVYNADLENWKESMAIICTFSDPTEFPDLCEALGDRIQEGGSRKDASFCYLVGSKLEKVVSLWVAELEEAEKAGMKEATGGSTFSVHAKSLQNFIEKVTVFRQVTKFQDSEQNQTSDWKLATLYDKYVEYADILASHGQLELAQKYLSLLPSSYPAGELARNRVQLATKKPAAQAAMRQTARQNTSSTASRVQQLPHGYGATQPAITGSSANPYGSLGQPPAPANQSQQYPPQNQYQPQGYQPTLGYQPTTQPAYGGGMVPPPPTTGGPRSSSSTPSGPPPNRAKKEENWNDVPLVTKALPRRSTPVAPIMSPFPGSASPTAGLSAPPTGPPPPGGYGHATSAAQPPPPKGPAPLRLQSPLTGQTHGIPPPRPSSTANQYTPPAPQPGAGPLATPQLVPRTASPYNAPPAGAPPSNRYAPSPATQRPNQPPTSAMPPPPAAGGRPPPPANPYGAPPQQTTSPGQYAPSPYAPQQGQTGGPLLSGPPPSLAQATPPPPQAAAPPPKAKHPAGDRSHMPDHAQRLVDILSQDMQRVAAKAPATFAPQVNDTQKRLNLLFDHLNNEELVQPATIDQLTRLAEAVQGKDYAAAQKLQVEIQRDKTEECGNWMVGVKRLISMSKATP